ncbi:hypothetical protein C0993_001287 [Termitomyces sp. T159_Od127]|nr:hypothetical protein C0993_001287 [Termitomyces sp. T159_Od127]
MPGQSKARYNPCLACLGGVDVVWKSNLDTSSRPGERPNLDGAVREEDTFVLGEDDSDYEVEKEDSPIDSPNRNLSLAVQDAIETSTHGLVQRPTSPRTEEEGMGQDISESSPLKYYIAQSDTLQGIVLRFGLDGHQVCRLNNLPPSTLRTTPHLLHTRRYLILPPSARQAGLPINKETSDQAAAREARWGKERAEKRLQTVTKEVDSYVAKAYVALADDPTEEFEEQEECERKRKEYGSDVGTRPSNLEERAIRKYLDDGEWEAAQRERVAKGNSNGKRGTVKEGIVDSWW